MRICGQCSSYMVLGIGSSFAKIFAGMDSGSEFQLELAAATGAGGCGGVGLDLFDFGARI